MRPLSLVPFILALASTACAHAPDSSGALVPHPAPTGPSQDPKADDPSGPTKPASVSGSFAASSNAFAVDLYHQLAQKGDNIAFSPASIETALEMTWAGAKGQTAEQMRRVLH